MNHLSCLSGAKSRRESHPDRKPFSSRGVGDNPWSMHCCGIERSWSGGLAPPPYSHLREARPTKMNIQSSSSSSSSSSSRTEEVPRQVSGHRKVSSTGSPLFGGLDIRQASDGEIEPQLVRSRGMRRDWSFEDLGGCKQMKPQVSG